MRTSSVLALAGLAAVAVAWSRRASAAASYAAPVGGPPPLPPATSTAPPPSAVPAALQAAAAEQWRAESEARAAGAKIGAQVGQLVPIPGAGYIFTRAGGDAGSLFAGPGGLFGGPSKVSIFDFVSNNVGAK